MIAAEDAVLILLAAGKSERFGDAGSKLDQALLGRPLGLHVAEALAEVPFRWRVAVVGSCRIDYAAHGFRVVPNRDPARDMASSLRLGIAQAADSEAVVIVLADMPRITAAHVRRLLDDGTGPDAIVASSDGSAPRPPALFGRDHFATLAAVTGDHGARDLIRRGRHVTTDPAALVDIDTRDDLDALRRLLGAA